MSPDTTRRWIRQQIDEHAPDTEAPSKAGRLAVAAAALRPGSRSRQVFGLAIPDDISRADWLDLHQRCMSLLALWPAMLDESTAAELGAMMVQLGLPPVAAPRPTPRTAARLLVFLPVTVEDLDTDEPIFDGARAASERVVDIACVRAATDGAFARQIRRRFAGYWT